MNGLFCACSLSGSTVPDKVDVVVPSSLGPLTVDAVVDEADDRRSPVDVSLAAVHDAPTRRHPTNNTKEACGEGDEGALDVHRPIKTGPTSARNEPKLSLGEAGGSPIRVSFKPRWPCLMNASS